MKSDYSYAVNLVELEIKCCRNIVFSLPLSNCFGHVGVEGQMNSSVFLDNISITFLCVSSSDLSEMKKLQVIIICLSNTIFIRKQNASTCTCQFHVGTGR